jgi:hypothetical protein
MKTGVKTIFFVMICALFLGCESKDDDDAITGTLSYNTEKVRWEIWGDSEVKFDGADIYIVKNYEVKISTESSRRVKVYGEWYPAEEWGPMAGMDFYIIEVERLVFL